MNSLRLAVALAAVAFGCAPSPRPLPSPPTVLAGAPALDPAAVPVAAAAPAGERYVGAIGGSPVTAYLQITPTSFGGRLFYEKGGREGLRLRAKPSGPRAFDVEERSDDDVVTGKMALRLEDATWSGTWEKPGKSAGLEVVLTREVRSRQGATVIRARRLTWRSSGAQSRKGVGFLPQIEGPGTALLARTLGLQALLDEDEDGLELAVDLDFDVVVHDERLVTFATLEHTEGAYPDAHLQVRTFLWGTGQRLGTEALLPAKRSALVRLLDARVKAEWGAAKKRLRTPSPETTCGPDVVEGFMDHDVEFADAQLADLWVGPKGLVFVHDYGFPHVVAACEPGVDLSLSWAEARPYVDPAGPLAAYR